MADENFWMNPRSLVGAKWHGGAGLLGERLHTMETLPATPPGTTDEFINGRWVPRDVMVPNQSDPATGGGQLKQYLGYEEEAPQKVIPAQRTKKWPWGQSIANMFRGAVNQIIPPAY